MGKFKKTKRSRTVDSIDKSEGIERRCAGKQRNEERCMSNAKSGKRDGEKELWQVGQAVRNKSKTVGRVV